jgi:hypothetical protein
MILLQDIHFDFGLVDSSSWNVAGVGYLVVFVSLVMLYLVFFAMPRVLKIGSKKQEDVSTAKSGRIQEEISGEVNAAIGIAMHMFFNEQHDEENTVLTVNRTGKMYSPWSSKIYGVTRNLNRRF